MTSQSCPLCAATDCPVFLSIDGKDYFRCPACHVTFLDPARRPPRDVEHRHYLLHENDITDPRYRKFLSRLANPMLAKLPAAQHGLDFGCGPGPALAVMFREAGHTMDVYDPFFASDRSVFDRQYDFITCTETAEHLHAPAAVFALFDRLLKPGAWLGIMTTFQTNDARFANWHYRQDPTHVIFYRQDTFDFLAKSFGWRCEIPEKNVALLHKPA
jgi:SAM-dependent methyltransferase